MLVSGLPRRTIYRAKQGVCNPHDKTTKRLVVTLELLGKNDYSGWRLWTVKKLAKVAKVPVKTAALMQQGRHTFISEQRSAILETVRKA